MVGVIDALSPLIVNEFPHMFSQSYFGDVGVYPPKAFQSNSGEWRNVLIFNPVYDKEGSHLTAAGEVRHLGIHIVVAVNMVPYFEALPHEAFGERNLVTSVMAVRAFLSQQSNFTLGGRVLSTHVGDVNWSWQQRKNNAIRAAALEYEVRSVQPRM